MCCVAAHAPDGGHTLSLQAEITGSTLRLILRLESSYLGARRGGARAFCPLLLRVLRFHPRGDSVDRSRDIPRFSSQDGDSQRVQQYRQRRLGIRKDAGHTLETAGSTCDLKGQSTVAHSMHEIDAITSPREIDF